LARWLTRHRGCCNASKRRAWPYRRRWKTSLRAVS